MLDSGFCELDVDDCSCNPCPSHPYFCDGQGEGGLGTCGDDNSVCAECCGDQHCLDDNLDSTNTCQDGVCAGGVIPCDWQTIEC